MNTSLNILKQYWGYDQFRPLQQDIVDSVCEGKDVLALLPTGGGKSICFQVPAIMTDGICIVITPLIALMKDQVEQLNRRDIKAIAIYAGMTKREVDHALDNCIYGQYKFLYISPERLQTELFQARVQKMNINFLVVDEAHCVSQWGYDFRLLYLKITEFRQLLPDKNLIALTATATEEVKQDIVEKLELVDVQKFQASFARSNLSYSVRKVEDKYAKLLEVLHAVRGSSIIYVRTRKATKQVTDFLRKNGVSSDYYHGGLSNQLRSHKQDQWIINRTRVIVATNAFGMGIDKPDVRLVVHLDLPDTLEAYYQEAGRAGRDGHKAYALVLHYPNDGKDLIKRVEQSHPPIDAIKRVYQSLANYYKLAVGSGEGTSYDFDISSFSNTYQLESLTVYQSIKKLEEQGLIQMNESFYSPSKLMFLMDNTALYEYMIANAKAEPFIKGVLRILGGEAYGAYVTISESKIAQHLGMNVDEVKRLLSSLNEQQVLAYQPTKDTPQIIFILPRQHENNLSLNEKFLNERKELALAKATSVSNYLDSINQCRTQQLLEYFGEKKEERCMVCDVCVEEKKRLTEDDAFIKVRSAILKELAESAMAMDELTDKLNGTKKSFAIEAIRKMLDFGEIRFDKNSDLTT